MSKELSLYQIETFCEMIDVTFDQFNVFLLNKSIDFFKNNFLTDPYFWTVAYLNTTETWSGFYGVLYGPSLGLDSNSGFY